MKKKNILMMVLSVCLIAIIAVGGTLAYFTDRSEVATNTFTAGKVDITLIDESPEHEGWKNGEKYKDEETKTEGLKFDPIMPDDTLSKRVAVTLSEDSQDAYVAVRVDIDMVMPYGNDEQKADKLVWLYHEIATATDDVWYMDIEPDFSAAVFYCKDVVSAGETVELLDSIYIPKEWGNECAGMDFSIAVEAAAIQAANVDEEMFREMPWDDFVALSEKTGTTDEQP